MITSENIDFKLDAELAVAYYGRSQWGHLRLGLNPYAFSVNDTELSCADIVSG